MRVVDRYFLKEYLKLLVVTELASVSIYLLVDTLSRVGNFRAFKVEACWRWSIFYTNFL